MKDTKKQQYDIIGDIHGHADALEILLKKLGYQRGMGHYYHPEGRVALFVGDLIDRGPSIKRVLDVVQGMCMAGTGKTVLGNHELNAMAMYANDIRGNPLRKSPRASEQHAATKEQFLYNPTEWMKALDWFWSLPIYLDLPELRLVHAAWDENAQLVLPDATVTLEMLADSQTLRNSSEGQMLKRLTCGVEVEIPEGAEYRDQRGQIHFDVRVAWWRSLNGVKINEAIFPPDPEAQTFYISEKDKPDIAPYGKGEKPVFFGHYWLPDDSPREPLAKNVACVDYSVAKGGRLTAYRWEGETELTEEHFIYCD